MSNKGEWLIIGLIILTLLCLGLALLVPQAISEIQDNETTRLRAEANLQQAKAERERARSEEWRREFQLYGVTLAAFLGNGTGWIVFLAAALGAVGALLIARLFNERLDRALDKIIQPSEYGSPPYDSGSR